MLKKILPYERDLFFLINGTRNHFLDSSMWLFSKGVIWAPLMAIFLFMLVYRRKWTAWLPLLVSVILVFVFCDQFSSGFCKPFFARLRPTHYPGFMEQVQTLYGYTGGLYGFTSGHATNSFGFATFTTLLFQKRAYSAVIYCWALIMIYSRVYLGVHFISDVIAGALAGSLIGALVYLAYGLYRQRLERTTTPIFDGAKWINIFTITIVCYTLLLMATSEWLILLIN